MESFSSHSSNTQKKLENIFDFFLRVREVKKKHGVGKRNCPYGKFQVKREKIWEN
jgi:hypothetical protein